MPLEEVAAEGGVKCMVFTRIRRLDSIGDPEVRLERGTDSSSPLLADGKIYCISEEGTTTVLKAGPEYEILAVRKLDSHTLASPVVVENQIFIRTADYLYCFQKR